MTWLHRILTGWLEAIWYGQCPLERSLLLPLSALFCWVAGQRRERLTAQQTRVTAPVLVVGNIAVGGTGKTPLTIALAQCLTDAGYHPGIVSRGYGSHPEKKMVRSVTRHNQAVDVGDEALLMAVRTGLPVVVGVNRVRAVHYLLDNHNCDVVLSDDGLQHYRLARDLEIAVIDGERRCGNGYCLPAGPLRERPERLQTCDFIVVNGKKSQATAGEYTMQVQGNTLYALHGTQQQALSGLAGQSVHVVTAIGNPQRFFNSLQQAGIDCQAHLYPDHHLFKPEEIRFDDRKPVLMTEKDAVKCRQFTPDTGVDVWYLPVSAELDAVFVAAFLQRVSELVTRQELDKQTL